MTDIAATVIVPIAQVDTARTIGGDQWRFIRPLTTDPTGPSNPDAEVTDYVSSGQADAGLLALILQLPGVIADYDHNHTWQDTLAAEDPQRYTNKEEN
jgi:hypothetical protein